MSGYGKKEILHGVSLSVGRGETVCLIGPNGAGKSTVLLTILGYLKPTAGRVSFRSEDITGGRAAPGHSARCRLLPAAHNIFPDMTVGEHLDLAAWTIGEAHARAANRRRIGEMFPIAA